MVKQFTLLLVQPGSANKEVTYIGRKAEMVETCFGESRRSLPKGATITVKDESGKVVDTITGKK